MHVQICVWSSLKNHSRTSINYTVKHIKNNEWNTVKHDKCNKQPLGISKNISWGSGVLPGWETQLFKMNDGLWRTKT